MGVRGAGEWFGRFYTKGVEAVYTRRVELRRFYTREPANADDNLQRWTAGEQTQDSDSFHSR